MPAFPLVQGFTEARLRRGLDAREVEEIRDYVLQGRAEPSDRQGEQLLRVAVLYGDYFTPSAKAAWEKLTGIPVDGAESVYRSEAKLYKNVLDVRLDFSKEKARIATDHALRKTRSQIDVVSRFSVDDVAARTATPPTPLPITHREAMKLEFSSGLYRRVLDAGAVAGNVALVDAVISELQALEKRVGDGDGAIVPRDFKTASTRLAAIGDALFTHLGPKALKIDGDVRPVLGAVLHEMMFSGRAFENRTKGVGADVFEAATRDVIVTLAREYHRDVVVGGESFTLFLEKNGVHKAAQKGEVLRTIEASLAPPTLDEIAGLYRLAVDEKLSARDFYTAARLDIPAVFQLQATWPERFARAPGQREHQALPARRTIAIDDAAALNSVDEIATAWRAEVTTGKKTMEQFVVDHGLRANVVRRMRVDEPALFPEPAQRATATNKDLAHALADAITAAAEADPFAKVPDLVAAVNRDPSFVAAHGEITYTRYYDVRRANQSLFSRTDDASRWMKPVSEAVRALIADRPEISRNEIVAELQKTWPQMTYSRLTNLKDAIPDVLTVGNRPRRSAADIDDLATRIEAMLRADPSRNHGSIAKELSDDGIAVDARGVSIVVRQYRPHLFSGIGAVDERRMQPRRHSLPSQALLQLAIRCSPPGCKVEDIHARYTALLEAKGITGLPASIIPRLTELQEKRGFQGPSGVHAKVASEIFAEYTRHAAKGTSEADIIAAIQKDWPTLDGRSLGRYRGMWRSAPHDFPALKPYKNGGDFAFVGAGAPDTAPRYRGGFNIERILQGMPVPEQVEWARLTEFAAMSLRLTEVDDVIADLNGSQPLANANVLWVSHLLGDVVPMGFALKDAGAEFSRTVVVGTPYGTNPSVKATLEDIGFDVRKPKLSIDDYKKTVKKAIDDIIERHKKNGEPICVLDDGGLVTDLLHTHQEYAPYRKYFRIVEQTTGGLLLVEKHKLESVVVNVARSESKALEGEAIGEVVAAKIVQALGRFGGGLKGKDTVLIGYGVVGPHVASEIAARGGKVTIIERNLTRAAAAKKAGFHVVVDNGDARSAAARVASLKKADLVVGATGRRTLSLEDMKHLRHGAAIASASSKRIELAMEDLTKAASVRVELPSNEPLVTLPTAQYRLGDRDLFVVGDGFPVNFDGGVQSVPPEKIQLTDAAMLAALFQASKIGSNKTGVVDLDPDVDQRLLARHRQNRAALTSKPTVYDPAKWREAVIAVAALPGV